jgi:hypothetical protein
MQMSLLHVCQWTTGTLAAIPPFSSSICEQIFVSQVDSWKLCIDSTICGWSDSHAAEYPLMKINNEGQVIQFNEKPRRESLTSMVCLHCLEHASSTA